MGRLLSWNSISKNKTNSRIPVKIGNDSAYAEEPEITVNVNGTKQIEITPKYSFNVFKEEDEEDSDFTFTSINEDIAKVNEKGLVTGTKSRNNMGKSNRKINRKRKYCNSKSNRRRLKICFTNNGRRWICSSIKSRWKYMGIWI